MSLSIFEFVGCSFLLQKRALELVEETLVVIIVLANAEVGHVVDFKWLGSCSAFDNCYRIVADRDMA
ncbi:hypothetical protein Ancab_038861, partial [Ancistrocladus abbreviatus]